MHLNPQKVLGGLLVGFAVLVVAVVAIGFMLPSSARLERSIVIERPPATVFTVLDGFRHFEDWSPWASLDPQMKTQVEGPINGVGARFVWTSEIEAVGSGSQEIVESEPYRRIGVRLVFSGMDTQNSAQFELEPQGEATTEVTWRYESQFGSSLMARYFGLMLDRRVGPDYERGLEQLKAHVETLADVDFAGIPVERMTVVAQPIAYVTGHSNTEPVAIARAYERAYAQINTALLREGIKPAGPPLAIGKKWDADRKVYEFEAAIPVPASTRALRFDRSVKIGQSYAGLVLRSVHKGPHDGLSTHLQKLMAYKQAVGFDSNGSPWDVYVSSASTSGRGQVTETYVPVR